MMTLQQRHKWIRRLSVIGTYLLVGWVIFAGIEIHSLTIYAHQWSKSQQNLVVIEKVFGDLKDMESGQRGYIITGDPDFYIQYTSGAAAMDYDFKILRAYLEDSRSQTKTVEELDVVIRAKTAEMLRAAKIYGDKGFMAAQEIIRSNKGAQQMKHIRYLIDVIKAREQASIKETAGYTF